VLVEDVLAHANTKLHRGGGAKSSSKTGRGARGVEHLAKQVDFEVNMIVDVI